MKFNKKQLEIIAYSLSLLVDDIEIKETKQETEHILIKLQSQKIYGKVNFYLEE